MKSSIRWMRPVAAGLLLALAAAGPAADEWAEAVAQAMRLGSSSDPAERARAAGRLTLGMDGKRDRQAVTLIITLLQNECAREAGGRKEHEVSGEVLLSCEEALKKVSSKEGIEVVVQQARKHAAPRVRFHLVRALGGIREEAAARSIPGFLADRDPRIVVAACDAVRDQAREADLDAILKVLRDPSAPWEGKLSLVEALEKIDRPESCVEGLVDVLGGLAADQGRLKVEIIRLLGRFCGIEDPKTDDVGWWKAAWADRKAGRVPARDGGTTTEPTAFFGLKTRSTRIVFILDRTGSMEDPCAFPPEDPSAPPPAPPEPSGRKPSPQETAARAEADRLLKKFLEVKARRKIDGLKREFARTVHGLDPRVHFAVVWYESNPTPWKEELVPATWANKAECLREIDRLSTGGGTNIWSALETAYRLVEAPRRSDVIQIDRKGNYATAVKGADTFFLMTDGNHNTGRFVTQEVPPALEAEAFLAELRKVNLLRRVVIHVVALGNVGAGVDPLTEDSLRFLEGIARDSGGRFAHIGKE